MSGRDSSGSTFDLAAIEARLRIEADDQTWVIDRVRPTLLFGRGAENDLTVGDRFASRRHGSITYRGGRFLLTDDSHNGTVVVFANGTMQLVHKETLLLHDRGAIRLGRHDGKDFAFVVEIRSGEGSAWQISGASPEPTADPTANVFRRDGDFWTICHEGRLIRLKDARGLRYLAHLLRHPDREFHALDLALGASEGVVAGDHPAPGAVSGAAGPVLDAQAKADYRRRLTDLRDELDEAERLNDIGRAGCLRDEMDAIVNELGVALGLGGRDREASSNAERGRVAVTRRIKDAIAKISRIHPVLGEHLSRSVHTGRFCSYRTETGRLVAWAL